MEISEGDLIRGAQQGDKDSMRRLCEAYAPLISKHARGSDDLEQAGWVGFLYAVEHFDPSRGAFRGYAKAHVVYGIKNETDSDNRISMPRKVAASNVEPEWVELTECVTPLSSGPSEAEDFDALASMLCILEEEECELVRSAFGIGRERQTQKALAAQWGVTPPTMRARLSRALQQMRTAKEYVLI